jgi:hypothetical protein
MFWTRTGSRGISSTFDLLLPGRFLFHLSIASGRLRCPVTGVPPQPNSPTDPCLEACLGGRTPGSRRIRYAFPSDAWTHEAVPSHSRPKGGGPADVQWLPVPGHSMSKVAVKVVVFHCRSRTLRLGGAGCGLALAPSSAVGSRLALGCCTFRLCRRTRTLHTIGLGFPLPRGRL